MGRGASGGAGGPSTGWVARAAARARRPVKLKVETPGSLVTGVGLGATLSRVLCFFLTFLTFFLFFSFPQFRTQPEAEFEPLRYGFTALVIEVYR